MHILLNFAEIVIRCRSVPSQTDYDIFRRIQWPLHKQHSPAKYCGSIHVVSIKCSSDVQVYSCIPPVPYFCTVSGSNPDRPGDSDSASRRLHDCVSVFTCVASDKQGPAFPADVAVVIAT